MITDNLKSIQSHYGDAKPTLIAISKKQPDDRVNQALDAGIREFGENRVQEAQTRWSNRRDKFRNLKLHLIGPLQTNKVKDAVELFDCIHTIDREKLAHTVYKHAPNMPCFIQVNTGAEPQKSGILIDELDDFHAFCVSDLGMNIIGLMCIPPADRASDNHFQLLAQHARKLNLTNLSMGMSGDYQTALEHGATHIRIGSGLFGERES